MTKSNSNSVRKCFSIPPVISIGMPVYNGARYIREALDSLLGQTFTDFELIISDNASIDNTEAICREYAAKDQRIRYIRQSQNLGASANFKFVLDEALGEYFMWAAYDDKWSSNYLLQAKKSLENTNFSFAFPTFKLQSIHLPLSSKERGEYIFKFIESEDRKKRVITFLSLHHFSFAVNIVYCFFRKDFLKSVYSLQDLNNEGTFGTVALSFGRGVVLKNVLFFKRYPKLWPGALGTLYKLDFRKRRDRLNNFNLNKKESFSKLIELFPEYANEIKIIFDSYKIYTYGKDFKICDIEHMLI